MRSVQSVHSVQSVQNVQSVQRKKSVKSVKSKKMCAKVAADSRQRRFKSPGWRSQIAASSENPTFLDPDLDMVYTARKKIGLKGRQNCLQGRTIETNSRSFID